MKVNLLQSQSNWSFIFKIKRLLWLLVQPFFFSATPRFFTSIRVLLLRLFGAQLGKRVLIMGGTKIWMPWNLVIGDFSAIGRNVEIYNFGTVTIGTHTVVSQYSYLCTATHDYTHPHMPLIWYPITIGSECWIAAGVFLGPGVALGDGCVIGAHSVVTKDMPDWWVCAGNPCRTLKKRELTGGD